MLNWKLKRYKVVKCKCEKINCGVIYFSLRLNSEQWRSLKKKYIVKLPNRIETASGCLLKIYLKSCDWNFQLTRSDDNVKYLWAKSLWPTARGKNDNYCPVTEAIGYKQVKFISMGDVFPFLLRWPIVILAQRWWYQDALWENK